MELFGFGFGLGGWLVGWLVGWLLTGSSDGESKICHVGRGPVISAHLESMCRF